MYQFATTFAFIRPFAFVFAFLLFSCAVPVDEPVAEAQQALQESWLDTVEKAPIGIHRVATNASIIYLNPRDAAAIGYIPAELVNTDVRDLHASQWTINSMLARLVAGEELHNYPARLFHKDGETIVYVSINSVLGEDGLTRCFTTTVSEDVFFLLWWEHWQAGEL